MHQPHCPIGRKSAGDEGYPCLCHAKVVKSKDLREGDVIRTLLDSPYMTHTVKRIRNGQAELFRPYVLHDTAILACFIGIEQYSVNLDNREWVLLRRY